MSNLRYVSKAINWGSLTLVLALAGCLGESPEALMASAKSHIEKKDHKSALIQLKNALQKNPSLAEARYLLGTVLLDGGDLVGATVELSKAEELGYSPDLVVPALARALLAQQAFDKLIARYGKTELKTPAAVADLRVALGAAHAASGDLAAASAAVQAALQAVPNHVDAQLLSVRVLAAGRDLAGANAALQRVLEQSPKSSSALQLKGDLLMAEPQGAGKARVAYEQAIALDHSNLAAYGGLMPILIHGRELKAAGDLLARLEKVAPNHTRTRFFKGWLALETNDLPLASEQTQALLKVMPDNADVLYLAGSVEMRRNALTLAEDHLAKALSIAPSMAAVRLQLTQVQLRRGDSTKALATLQPLLSLATPPTQALVFAAEAQLLAGDSDKAEQLFARAAKQDPSNVTSRIALALAQIGKGQVDAGVAALRETAASEKGIAADMALVGVLWRHNRTDEAVTALDAVEKKQPDQVNVANLRGRVELSRGKRDAARGAFEAALKIAPTNLPAVLSLVSMDIQDKHTDQARRRLEKLLEIEPNNARAQLALIRMNAAAGAGYDDLVKQVQKAIKSAPSEREARAMLIRLHLSKPDVKLALLSAQEANAAITDDAELLQLLGQAQQASGELNQAISTYSKLIAKRPELPQPYMLLADAYARSANDPQVLQTYRRAIAAVPDHMQSYQALVALEMAAGRQKQALEVARMAQARQAGDFTGYMLEGDIALAHKNLPGAAAVFKLGLERTGAQGLAIRLHRTLVAMGKRDEAATLEKQRLQRVPNDAAFITYLADLATAQGQLEVAEQHYRRLLEMDQNNGAALNNLAWMLYRQKRDGALELAERANKAVPNRPEFMDTLAEIHAGQGRLNEAIDLQKKSVALAPDYHLHRLHLAKFLVAAGRKSEAKEELERLAKLGDKFAQQADVRKLSLSL